MTDRQYFENLLRGMWNDLSQLHRKSNAEWRDPNFLHDLPDPERDD